MIEKIHVIILTVVSLKSKHERNLEIRSNRSLGKRFQPHNSVLTPQVCRILQLAGWDELHNRGCGEWVRSIPNLHHEREIRWPKLDKDGNSGDGCTGTWAS